MHSYKLLLSGMVLFYLFCSSDQQKNKTPQQIERSLINQLSVHKWEITDFSDSGPVNISDSVIIIGAGNGLTGVTWTGNFPKKNYELSARAMRITGNDFFCGLTFPVRGTFCTLIFGGWGGSVVGISNVDWSDASENITTLSMSFRNNIWYVVRLKVTQEKILVWIDDELVIDLLYLNHPVSLHRFMGPAVPVGFAT